jgi:uncharacterized protein (TIGR01777 family)
VIGKIPGSAVDPGNILEDNVRVVITGATGLIGSQLVQHLDKKNYFITVLSRNPQNAKFSNTVNVHYWDGETLGDWVSILESADAVINLAGENIGSGRWTNVKKQKILESRIKSGKILTAAFKSVQTPPRLLIQSSAIGIYGTSLDEVFDEDSQLGWDWLAQIGKAWEGSTVDVEALGVRRVVVRTGVVLDKNGGAFPLIYLPFQYYIGGKLGSGQQWVSWIHLQDVIRAVESILEDESIVGVINLTSPNPVTNAEFGKTIAMVTGRPYWLPVPGFALRFLLGEQSILVLKGQNVLPKKLLDQKFEFQYPLLPGALRSVLTR